MTDSSKPRKFGEGNPQEGDTFSREICFRCGRESCLGFLVPHEMWDKVYESSGRKFDVLCIQCFDELCDDEWDDEIEFYPASRAAFNRWLSETTHEEKVAQFKAGVGDVYKRGNLKDGHD